METSLTSLTPWIFFPRNHRMGLGDLVERALTSIGVTSERVERWLGRPCNCKERQQKLNQLGHWAARVSKGLVLKASEYLNSILEED